MNHPTTRGHQHQPQLQTPFRRQGNERHGLQGFTLDNSGPAAESKSGVNGGEHASPNSRQSHSKLGRPQNVSIKSQKPPVTAPYHNSTIRGDRKLDMSAEAKLSTISSYISKALEDDLISDEEFC